MGAKDGRPEEARRQVAEVLRRAEEIVGSRHHLAQRLGVAPRLLTEWIEKRSDAPDDVVRAAVDVILERRGR